jgi:hypothetical protein
MTMSKQELTSQPGDGPQNGLAAAEARLGQVLALIHRVLPRLDEPHRTAEVQAALQKAASLLEGARQAHAHETPPAAGAPTQRVATAVAPEIAAVIAAAVAVTINRPYRLVSVQQVATPVPHLNVWALEGRTQIFQSHKIR